LQQFQFTQTFEKVAAMKITALALAASIAAFMAVPGHAADNPFASQGTSMKLAASEGGKCGGMKPAAVKCGDAAKPAAAASGMKCGAEGKPAAAASGMKCGAEGKPAGVKPAAMGGKCGGMKPAKQ
jgi:hypothetical protein